MAETKSKFAGLFQKEAEPENPPELQPSRIERTPATARPIGRPPGKRSDPAWKQYSVLLRRETQRQAAAILRDRDDGQDLSGLVQKLLETWVKKQKP